MRCAFYVTDEKTCSRSVVAVSKSGDQYYDYAKSVRLDPKRCGPDAKFFVARVGLKVVE
jgi:hypothetical protein